MTRTLGQHLAALRALLVLTVLLGLGYPLAVTAVAQLAAPGRANGSLVRDGGTVVGSALLGQAFAGPDGTPLPQWFQPRPSAAGATAQNPAGYDPTASGASNLGPTNPDLIALVKQRRAAVAAFEGVPADRVPPDAVTASGSGLDPDISPEYAALQVDRVARARGLDPAVVARLVREHTRGRTLGFLGEPRVDVLGLNLALARLG
jgi:K+-transporting ATPase ATPase C chain